MKRVLTTREAAEYLGVSYWTMVSWRARRTGPAYSKLGGRTGHARYKPSDLDAFAERRQPE